MFRQKYVVLVVLVVAMFMFLSPAFAAKEVAGESDRAVILNALHALIEKNPDILSSLIPLIEAEYIQEAKIDETIELYKSALSILPENEDFLSRLGSLYVDRASFKKAIDVYGKLIKLRPRAVQYSGMLSDAYSSAGNEQKAVAVWEDLTQELDIVLDSDDSSYLRDKGHFYMRAERHGEAEAVCNILLKTASDRIMRQGAISGLISIYEKQNRLADLAAKFQNDLAIAPEDPDQHIKLAALYQSSGETDKAIEVYKEAFSAGVSSKDMHYALLAIYEWAERFDEAGALIVKMMNDSPEDFSLYEKQAGLLEKAGKIEEAREALGKYMSMVKEDISVVSMFAERLYTWGDLNAAIEQQRKVQSLDPDNLWHSMRVADMWIGKERFNEAKGELNNIIAETTDDGVRRAAKERLEEMAVKLGEVGPLRKLIEAPVKTEAPEKTVKPEPEPRPEKKPWWSFRK